MDYKNKLQTNNTALEGNNLDLQTILNTINSLPEAGSGASVNLDAEITAQDAVIAQIQSALEGKAASGNTSIDTCTIMPLNFNNSSVRYLCYTFTTINNGAIATEDAGFENIMNNVICGSALHVDATMSYIDPANLRLDGEEPYSWFSEASAIFIVPYKNGETISFTLEQ